jgi:predicted RNA-binding protein YlqC (UPF0109 family)
MMQNSDQIRKYVKHMIAPLLEEPERLKISVAELPSSCVIELVTSRPDVGKVIGRRGTTINAIRRLTYAFCSKLCRKNTRIYIGENKIREQEDREKVHNDLPPSENGVEEETI